VEYIHLAHDKDKLRALLNTVMSLLLTYNGAVGAFLSSWKLCSFLEELCYIKLSN
jgi:hypothetical protein